MRKQRKSINMLKVLVVEDKDIRTTSTYINFSMLAMEVLFFW